MIQATDIIGIHPERYPLLEKLAARLGKNVGELVGPGAALVKRDAQLRAQVGQFTFDDIVKELERSRGYSYNESCSALEEEDRANRDG